MTTGALIVAAGMSSRMGEFKPMLNIGSISIAQRIVANFKQSGIEKIVMVTGYNALELERHLSKNGIVFLRNEQYETTQMFDSAKIGLDYLKDKVDNILFTPVDIPLFNATTINKILSSNGKLVCPVCNGEEGHPILISSGIVQNILQYNGNNGLKGAMESCGVKIEKIEVDDIGILRDADTPDDYSELIRLHNSGLMRSEVFVSISKEIPFFTEQMADLLELIDDSKSVRDACTKLQMSYSKGWNIIKTLESQLSKSLIERTQGGSHGGQSCLTEYGKSFLKKYRDFSHDVREYANSQFGKYFNGKE